MFCLSGQANSSQNSNVDNILPDLDTNPSIASKIFRDFNFSYILPGKTSVSSASSSSSSSDSSSSPSEKNNDFANVCFCLVSLPFLLLRIRLLPPPLLVPLENFFADFVGDPENFETNYLLSGLLILMGLKMYLDKYFIVIKVS
jgi:hypothetical protein